MLLVAFASGLCLVLASFSFTYWLSFQALSCPPWALDCRPILLRGIKDPRSALPIIQGIVGFIHGLGLTCLFFVATDLAEPTLWPLLRRKSYNLETIDVYLQGTRGSLLSIFQSLFHSKDKFASIVLLCVALTAALNQLDRIVIGEVYSLRNITHTYQSNYSSGGGIGINIPDSNSDGPLADPAVNGFAYYTSWSKSLTDEPLPDMREFIVDRYNLSRLQSFTVSSLKAQKTITCSSRPLAISNITDRLLGVTAENSLTKVSIRTEPRLSCWIDSNRTVSPTVRITTLMFAAMDGFIEGGAVLKQPGFNITSLQCEVKTELLQVTYSSGSGGPQTTEISSNRTVKGSSKALLNVDNWMGGAVTAFGVRVYNARPMFGVDLLDGKLNPAVLPQAYATTYSPDGKGWDLNYWTQPALKNFINVTAGAIAIAMSQQMNEASVTIHSNSNIPKISTARSFLLLLPAGLILLVIATLFTISILDHRATKTHHVRLATIPEWTKSICAAQSGVDGGRVHYKLQKNSSNRWGLDVS